MAAATVVVAMVVAPMEMGALEGVQQAVGRVAAAASAAQTRAGRAQAGVREVMEAAESELVTPEKARLVAALLAMAAKVAAAAEAVEMEEVAVA